MKWLKREVLTKNLQFSCSSAISAKITKNHVREQDSLNSAVCEYSAASFNLLFVVYVRNVVFFSIFTYYLFYFMVCKSRRKGFNGSADLPSFYTM